MSTPAAKTLQVLVTCEACGLVFRTGAQHVGAAAPCPACGKLLSITGQVKILAPEVAAAIVATPPPSAPIAPLPVLGAIHPAGEPPALTSLGEGFPSAAATINQPPLAEVQVDPPPLPTGSLFLPPAYDRSTWGCLFSGLAGMLAFAGIGMILLAAILAIVPPPNESWAEQKWSGVVCSVLTAATCLAPGIWFWRRARHLGQAGKGESESRIN